jgi:NDP-sugar pyrophosphorylase family protein
LTEVVAKPAIPVLDVPLAAWSLASLRNVAEVPIVNVSHLGDTVVRALAPLGAFEVFVEEPEGFGTAGTLKALEGRLGDRVVTANGDLVADIDVAALVATHERIGAPATVVVKRVSSGADLSTGERSQTDSSTGGNVPEVKARSSSGWPSSIVPSSMTYPTRDRSAWRKRCSLHSPDRDGSRSTSTMDTRAMWERSPRIWRHLSTCSRAASARR